MSAPPNFNEQASNLPDPGAAAAPIHMMRGGGDAVVDPEQIGGKPFSMEEENILESHGLTNSAITQHIPDFDDEFKNTFLRQFRSGKCEQKGNSITKRDCWAVTTVIKAIIEAKIAQGNELTLPGMVPDAVINTAHTEASPKAPTTPKIGTPTGVDPLANNENDDDTLSDAARLAANAARLAVAEGEPSVAPCIRGPDSIEGLDDSDALSRMSAVSPDNVNIELPPTPNNVVSRSIMNAPAATPAAPPATPSPLGRGPAVVPAADDYFLENPANFRKGQYGINLNTNASKRIYANAVVGTKRMRIRGRNAENIKRRYNTKKNALVAQATTARAARNAEIARATAERTRVNAARAAAASAASAANATAKRLRAERVAADKVVKQTTQTLRKSEKEVAEAARRANVAAGIQKPSFMNRMKSIKNPFKRGGSRKTRRNTRRGNRR